MSAMMRGIFPKIAISLCLLLLSGTGCAELDRIFGQPYVTITSPVNGETVQGNSVTVEGTAEDGVGVVRLVYELQNSDGRSGEIDIFSNFSPTSQAFSFEITDLKPGTNTITVVAYDGDNYRNQESVSITVEDTGPLPFDIVFTSPGADFTTIETEVDVAGTILNSDGKPISLETLSYEVSNSDGKGDTTDILDNYNADEGGFSFSVADLTLGRNTITLTATDDAGNTVEADLTLTVEEPSPVTLTLTAPADLVDAPIFGTKLGLLGDLGGNIPVTSLTYSLNDGVAVEFVDALTAERQFHTIIADLTDGTHTLTVAAVDAQENTASATRSFKVSTSTAPISLTLAPLASSTLEPGATILTLSGHIGTAQNVSSLSYHFGDPTQAITVPADAILADAEDPVYPQSLKFSFDADLAGLAPGKHTLTLTAADVAENMTSSDVLFTLEGEVPAPICGDDVISGDEACDSTQLNGSTCVDFGFGAGDLACSTACALDTTSCTGASFVGLGVGRDAVCGLLGDNAISCVGFDLFPRNGQFSSFGFGSAGLCAIRIDGTMSCYGDSLNTPPDAVFSAVAVSNKDVCALSEGGLVSCWPAMAADETAPFSNPSGAALNGLWADSTGDVFCGLGASNKTECWTRAGVVFAPEGVTFQSLSIAADRACGLTAEGAVSCWNGDTQIDSGAPEGEVFERIALGRAHACGLKADGAIACWGDNALSQLEAPQGVTFKGLSAAGDNTCAIDTAAGQLKCWGPASAAGTLPSSK